MALTELPESPAFHDDLAGRASRDGCEQARQAASDRALADALQPLLLDRAWVAEAACAGRSEFFFDPIGETPTQRRRREASARTICESCPVQYECRTSARENREHGFWGAENEEERTLAGYMPRSSGRRTVLAARRRANATQPGTITDR